MEFENRFDVPLPPDQAWKVLLDVPRITPCLPGAELVESLGDNRYKGKVAVKLGPVALSFSGTAQLLDVDDTAHMARIEATGNDTKGRGNARAKVAFKLDPTDGGTRVSVRTDLTLAGMVAQYGRGVGMIQTIADQLIAQFVAALKEELARAPAPAASVAVPAPAVAAKPISGFALLWAVLRANLRRLFGS